MNGTVARAKILRIRAWDFDLPAVLWIMQDQWPYAGNAGVPPPSHGMLAFFFFDTPRLRFTMLNVGLSIAIHKWRSLPRRRWCQYGEEWALVTYPEPMPLGDCNISGLCPGLV